VRSRSKVAVPGETIAQLAAHHLPDARLASVRPLDEGMYNAAYLLAFSDRSDAVVKVAPPDGLPRLGYEQHLMRAETDYFRLVEAHAPVPHVIAADFSRTILDRDVLITSKLEGRSLLAWGRRLGAADRRSVRLELGRAVGAVHAAVGNDVAGYGQDRPGLTGATWSDAFAAMMLAVLDDVDAYGIRLGVPAGDIMRAVHAHESELARVARPVLVHFDLWAGNVFAERVDGRARLTGVIDGERAFWGDPVAELVSTSLFTDPRRDLGFNQGYAETNAPLAFDESTLTRIRLASLYLSLIMLAEGPPRGYRGLERALTVRYVRRRIARTMRRLA